MMHGLREIDKNPAWPRFKSWAGSQTLGYDSLDDNDEMWGRVQPDIIFILLLSADTI